MHTESTEKICNHAEEWEKKKKKNQPATRGVFSQGSVYTCWPLHTGAHSLWRKQSKHLPVSQFLAFETETIEEVSENGGLKSL